MSDINEEAQAPEEEVHSEIEVSVPEEEVDESTSEGEESTEDEDADGEKPWKPKKKQSTPTWARDRFRKYSQTVNELKAQNQQLMETMKQYLDKGGKTEDKKLSKEDFPDETAYLDHLAEEKFKQKMSEYQRQQEEITQRREQYTQLQQADASNVEKAKEDLPDYMDVIRHGDPDVTLPKDVINHLSISPAGPYVRYKIAADEELSEALKQATPQQKVQIVSELHDNILDYLGKKSSVVTQEQTAVQPKQQTVQTTQKSTGQRKPPKAPPKQKSGTRKDLLSLDGDAYARARNGM